MPQLPNKYDLGGPGSFRSGRTYATADTTAVGAGLAALGRGISNLGTGLQDAADERRIQNRIASIPPVDAGAKSALSDFVRDSIDPSTDYQAYGKTFEAGAAMCL